MDARLEHLFRHPLVLQSAWRRVLGWYRSGEWAPEPAFSEWRLATPKYLSALGQDLAKGYRLGSPYPLVAYPKKGGLPRHYCRPPVRDQVAFAVVATLLAPALESRMPTFSFGNRWFQGVYRDWPTGAGGRPTWRERPFSLADTEFYQPFRRGHGLFRRVAHWTAVAMLGDEPDGTAPSPEDALRPSDYPDSRLPGCVRSDWWAVDPSVPRKTGFWAELDLQLAYPSVDVNKLRTVLRSTLSSPEPFPSDPYQLYPQDIYEALSDREVQVILGDYLATMLEQVRYSSDCYSGVGDDPWVPPHVPPDHRLPVLGNPDWPGLPTGLAISGLLLNAYLLPFDQHLDAWTGRRRTAGSAAACLRFADDIVVLGASQSAIFEAIDVVREYLSPSSREPWHSSSADATTARPGSMRINWSKLGPAPLRDIVDRYLAATEQWQECPGCRQIVPRSADAASSPRHSLAEWVEGAASSEGVEPLLAKWSSEALSHNRLHGFVTRLVEELSDLGRDDPAVGYGDACEAHLRRLNDLVRLNLADDQVRQDTLHSFAANRLASAWLPETSPQRDAGHLREIRRSISEAIRISPWKFKMWRAVVRAAARRVVPQDVAQEDNAPSPEGDETASEWLSSMLALLAAPTPSATGETSTLWRLEDLGSNECWRHSTRSPPNWSALRQRLLSTVRTAVWTELACALRDIDALESKRAEFDEHPLAGPPRWPSRSWTFRGLTEAQLPAAREFLAKIDTWVHEVYGSPPAAAPLSEEEVEALTSLAHYAVPLDIVHSTLEQECARWFEEEEFRCPFQIPAPLVGHLPEQLATVLARDERLERGRGASLSATLLHIPKNGTIYRRLASELTSGRSQHANLDERLSALRATHTLGAAAFISSESRQFWLRNAEAILEAARDDPASSFEALRDYALARRSALSDVALPQPLPRAHYSLQRLLWLAPLPGRSPQQWPTAPALAPGLGLPPRIALHMLHEMLTTPEEPAADPVRPPTWIVEPDALQFLLTGRANQLRGAEFPLQSDTPYPSTFGHLLKFDPSGHGWEFPPHAAHFLPWTQANSPIDPNHARDFSAVLHFLSLLTGRETYLDSLLDAGLGPARLQERLELRASYPLPGAVWKFLDQHLRSSTVVNARTSRKLKRLHRDAIHALAPYCDDLPAPEDFNAEVVEVNLSGPKSDYFSVTLPTRAPSRRATGATTFSRLDTSKLAESISLRVGQLSVLRPGPSTVSRRLCSNRRERRDAMRQANAVFDAPQEAPPSTGRLPLGPVLLPEVAIPFESEPDLRLLAQGRHRSLLAGLTWSPVPAVFTPSLVGPSTVRAIRFFRNEAVLVTPLFHPSASTPIQTAVFRVSKVLPSHAELGLAKALSSRRIRWRMETGNRWYRFLHPAWGDFSIAICADLLDSSPWHTMRGALLHLFQCACNRDVELFEALTWVRAYESYVNVVSSNAGQYGGSFVWTPKRAHGRELASLRGGELFLVADVILPVKELLEQQRSALDAAVASAKNGWRGRKSGTPQPTDFKTPPTNYRRRD